jgi:Flp pilus assembly protein TadG
VLAVCVVGIVDISNAYSRKLALEQGTQRAIEKIMQTTDVDTVENTLKDEVCKQVDGLASDGKTCLNTPITTSDVTVTYTFECKNITTGALSGQATTTDAATFDAMSCTGTDKEQRYIQVAATGKYTPMFPMHFAGFTSSDGTYHVSAKAGMRIE